MKHNADLVKLVPFLVVMTLMIGSTSYAQQISRKHTSDRHQRYYDSLINMKYDRVFPILGEKVYKKGFDIPFPIGIMINNYYGSQEINISDIQVGITSPDSTFGPVDLSNVITFSEVNARAYNVNARVDVWVLPFLNINALVAYLPFASTRVTLSKPLQLSTNPKQQGWASGVGIMGAGGIGPIWIQSDYNATWADMQLLDNKVFTQVIGLRAGHVFTSKRSAAKNISVWVGAMGIFVNNRTIGQIALSDVFPSISQERIDEIKESYSEWYDDLDPLQKKVADKIVEKLQDKVDRIDITDTYITYQMNKELKSKWAGLVGMQYQFNKSWQARVESNFIGRDRFSILASINYRFVGFKKKNSKP